MSWSGRSDATQEANDADGVDTRDLESLGHYKLLAKLGEGGMGAVYKALHTKLDKVVALKVLPAERMKDATAVQRFEREMKAVGKLDHPNIVAAHDAGEVDGRHYLVMELVDGVDLSTLVRRVGPAASSVGWPSEADRDGSGDPSYLQGMTVADACELVRQAAVGLQEAHEHGMVHRDIKPSNLMLAQVKRGREPFVHSTQGAVPAKGSRPLFTAIVKILDMGLALLQDQHSPNRVELTSTGQLMGTLDYMAPEQGTDSHDVDVRADIYSLGATLFKLLTGESLFPAEEYGTLYKRMMAVFGEDAPSISTRRTDLPSGLVAVVDRMLAKSPDQRFSTPEQVAEALEPLCGGHNLADLLERAASEDAETAIEQTVTGTHEHLTSDSRETVTANVVDPDGSAGSAPVADIDSVSHATAPIEQTIELSDSSSSASGGRESADSASAAVPAADPALAFDAGLPAPTKRPTEGLDDPDSGRPAVEPAARSGDLATTQSVAVASSRRSRFGGKMPPLRYLAIAGSLGGAILLATVLLTIRTPHGEVVVELGEGVKPEEVKIEVDGGGDLKVIDAESNWTIEVVEGKYDVNLAAGQDRFNLDKDSVLVTRDEVMRLQVILKSAADVGSETVSATPQSDIGDSDRRAAEYVLSVDGFVTIEQDGQQREIKASADLPRAPFRLTGFNLTSSRKVTNAGLATFEGCKHLTRLKFLDTTVGDDGLAYFKDCPVTYLVLGVTSVTDEGLAHFKDHNLIQNLNLQDTAITDAGLAYFEDCEQLGGLTVYNTDVTDEGLSVFKDKSLTQLGLDGTQITDAGLARGFANEKLQILGVSETLVTDAGLEHLKACRNLVRVDVRRTKVTAAGIAELQTQLPDCRIISDFSPDGDVNGRVAKWVQEIGAKGELLVKGATDRIPMDAESQLPNGEFEICSLDLTGAKVDDDDFQDLGRLNLESLFVDSPEISDKALEHLKASTSLRTLGVQGTQITDMGLRFLDNKKLTHLLLGDTRVRGEGLKHIQSVPNQVVVLGPGDVGDAALANLRHLTELDVLDLRETKITDAGLEHLRGMEKLRHLTLDGTRITGSGLKYLSSERFDHLTLRNTDLTDAGLAGLAGKRINSLDLDGTTITDRAAEHLVKLEHLVYLHLRGTRLTTGGVAQIRQAFPSCEIFLDGHHLKPGDPVDSLVTWQPGPSENVLPGLIPRPVKLPGIGRWQVVGMPEEAMCWLSPDGNYLAWTMNPVNDTSTRRFVVLQETESRRPVACALVSGVVNAADWSSDSTRLAVSDGYKVHEINIDGSVRTVLEARIGPDSAYEIHDLRWSPDGKALAVASPNPNAGIWLVQLGEKIGPVVFKRHESGVLDLAWKPDGEQLASAGVDTTVRTWSADGTAGPVLKGHTDGVSAVAWSPDGKWLASGSNDGEVRFWQPDGTAGPVTKIDGGGKIAELAWSPDSRWLSAASAGGSNPGTHILDVNGKVAASVQSDNYRPFWSPDSKRLAITDQSGTFLFAPDGSVRPKVPRPNASVVWSRDGSRLLLADKHRVTQWFGVDGREFPEVTAPRASVSGLTAWSPDGRHLAVSHSAYNRQRYEVVVAVWSAEGELEWVQRDLPAPISGLSWSPDSQWLATAGHREKLRLWQADGTPGPVLAGHTIVAWSPDGEWIAATSGRGAQVGVSLWKPDGTKGAMVEKGIAAPVSIAWSPSGKQFAVGSYPNDIDSRHLLSLFQVDGSSGPMWEADGYATVWSPDEKWIAVGRVMVRLWQTDGTPGPTLEKTPSATALYLAWSADGKSVTAYWNRGYVTRWGIDGNLQETIRLGSDVLRSEPTADGQRLAIIRNKGVVEVVDAESLEVQWVGVPLSGGQAAAFTPAGQLMHAPPEVEKHLIYAIEKPDGQFAAMSRGDFLRRVSLPADKLALQWLIDVGGSFTLEGDDKTYSAANVKTIDDLPGAANSPVSVNLRENQHFTADDLALLAALPNLVGLDIAGTNIGTPAVEQIGRLRSLTTLDLSDTEITNSALAQLAGLENLTTLRLRKTTVSTAGLEHLAGMTQLSELDLSGTGASNFGLGHLSKLTNLQSLDLSGTVVSDSGLKSLARCTNLRQLNLAGTNVTAPGVAALRETLPECDVRLEIETEPKQ